ncbi:hypothetical protein ALI144C_38865 [Actinosynnema sp. ALI-1.44]|uniref:tetratricopeptide repeat protein n=1 Tax=Actinosynnema sp. ALI-1.44 TaxID=1933779 RepID=UPI00097BC301|nr:hypothetical protein [Actinosynnema sp. ALI-1.44]ONI74770.1 hypothetical protein ALI144C_38865 [Actinosynnema sp. ALI-1.44]
MNDRLSRSDLLYEPLIAQYLGPGFVERTWLAGRVEQHFDDPGCRFVLLTGGPGTGKSAFLAWLSQRHALSPRYFLRRLSNHPLASGDASSLLLSVGHQLAVLRPDLMRPDVDVSVEQTAGTVAAEGRVVGVRVGILQISPFGRTAIQVEQHADVVEGTVVGLDIERLVVDPRLHDLGTLQSLALLDPAIRLAHKQPDALVVVLIDALDELRFQFGGHGDIVEWLAACPELPANLRIVVSCRPDRQLLQRFRIAQADRLREETIEPASGEVTGDVVVYVHSVLSDPALSALPRIDANRIATHAQGSFLYVAMWARGLRDAAAAGDQERIAALTGLSTLPNGLAGIYEYFIALVRDGVRRREGDQWKRIWKRVHRRLLGVLAVAQAAVSVDQVLLLADLEQERADSVDALDDLEQFLIEDDNGIRLCHRTFAEFLTDRDRWREDWYVDAQPFHRRVADQLLAEYGDSWAVCEDEYALGHVVTHLVAAGEASDRLPGLLRDPGFGFAKATRVGIGAALADYIAANAELPGNTDIAAGLAVTLAKLADHGLDNVADHLHAVVGYHGSAKLLHELVLDHLSDPAFLEQHIVDDQVRRAALISFSLVLGTRLRRSGQVAEAREVFQRAVPDIDAVPFMRQKSMFLYELGFIEFLLGRPEQALEWLNQSADYADNPVSASISKLVALRVGLLSGAVSAEDYLEAHEEALAFFTGPEASGPHASRWVTSAHGQLLDLGLWTQDTELIGKYIRLLEDDPWIRETGRDDILLKHRARAAAVTGDWAAAIPLFEAVLADAHEHREELARDLYYYGKALAGSGDADKAREVWQAGLDTPGDAANWPWQALIRREM